MKCPRIPKLKFDEFLLKMELLTEGLYMSSTQYNDIVQKGRRMFKENFDRVNDQFQRRVDVFANDEVKLCRFLNLKDPVTESVLANLQQREDESLKARDETVKKHKLQLIDGTWRNPPLGTVAHFKSHQRYLAAALQSKVSTY